MNFEVAYIKYKSICDTKVRKKLYLTSEYNKTMNISTSAFCAFSQKRMR